MDRSNFTRKRFNTLAGRIVWAIDQLDLYRLDYGPLLQWKVVAKQEDLADIYLEHPPVEQLTRETTGEILHDEEYGWINTCSAESIDPDQGGEVWRWRFSIVYSETYSIPILYFTVHHFGGAPCTGSEVLELFNRAKDTRSDFISQEDHPITGEPSFFLHPCQSKDPLGLMDRDDVSVLWAWMYNTLPVLGHCFGSPQFWRVRRLLLSYTH
jgi:hypothetical protein